MIHPRERPKVLDSSTYKFKMSCGRSLYITVSKNGGDTDSPFEIFLTMGKVGSCDRALIEGLGRAISLYLRTGGDPERISRSLRHIRCPHPGLRPDEPKSCPDAISIVIEKEYNKES